MRVLTPSGFQTRATPSVAAEEKAIKAAVDAASEFGPVGKSFLTGNAALGGGGSTPRGGVPVGTQGTSWNNQGGTSSLSNALIARVTQNLASSFDRTTPEVEQALAEQGLSWGPPFPPGRPLDPFYGYRRPARTWDFQVGENVQLTPRWNRISFQTLKALYEKYDVAQICVRHLIDDVRSLDINWLPPKNCKDDVTEDIEEAERFWAYPDRRQPFDCWLAEWLQDVLRYDAGALFIRETEVGDPYSIEVVSGETIIPLIDYYGRRPEDEEPEADPDGETEGHVTPAYLQIIKGLPWDWMTADQLVYQPLWPLPESQYGQCPLESVLLSANTDLRFQWHFLQVFTDGSLPAGFMEAPPDLSDPAQVEHWQEYWDSIMLGDQSQLNKIRWVPANAKFTPARAAAEKFDETFPLYLMRRMCAAYKVTPTDLGFTETVNRASSEIQVDVQARVGRGPLIQYVEGVVNLITTQRLGLRARMQIEKSDEVEDRVAVAQAHGIYIDHGVEGIDEVREELGKPIDKSRPAPRYINNTRAGPIPLLAIESQAGEIDPETYGRADTQQLVSTPYASPPGALPPQGSPEQKAAAETTAQASRDLIEATTGQKPPTAGEPTANGGELAVPDGESTANELTKGILGLLEKVAATGVVKCYAPDYDDEPVRTPHGTKYVQMVYDLASHGDDCLKCVVAVADEPGGEAVYLFGSDELAPAIKAVDQLDWRQMLALIDAIEKGDATAGITVATGVQGVDLKGTSQDDDDDDDDEVAKATEMALEVRRWRENARNRLRKGKNPAGPFTSIVLPADMQQQLRRALKAASTREEVDAAFAGLGKPSAGERPAFHSQADRICGHYSGQIAASLAKLYTSQQIHEAIQAAKDALPELSTAEKAAVWDKSEPELTLRELAYRGQLVKDAQLDLAFQAARQALEAHKPDVGALRTALASLYGDSLLQGAHDAAQASGGTVVASLRDVEAAPPAGYWNEWEPGYGDAAAQAADGGMRQMLDDAGIRIQGITNSATDRIGNTISQGLANGDSVDTVAKAVQEEISSPARAEVISTTEYARAMDTASVQTYEEAGIAEEDWLAEPDACPECEANAEGSPYPTGSGPDVPQHPNCRCAKAPHIAE